MSLPLYSTIVGRLRGTMSSRTTGRGFRNCVPRYNTPFLHRIVTSCCGGEKIGLSPSRIFISDNTSSRLKSVLSLFSGGDSYLIVRPTCPTCMSTGIVTNEGVIRLSSDGRGKFLPRPGRGIGTSVLCVYSPGGPAKTMFSEGRLRT